MKSGSSLGEELCEFTWRLGFHWHVILFLAVNLLGDWVLRLRRTAIRGLEEVLLFEGPWDVVVTGNHSLFLRCTCTYTCFVMQVSISCFSPRLTDFAAVPMGK